MTLVEVVGVAWMPMWPMATGGQTVSTMTTFKPANEAATTNVGVHDALMHHRVIVHYKIRFCEILFKIEKCKGLPAAL